MGHGSVVAHLHFKADSAKRHWRQRAVPLQGFEPALGIRECAEVLGIQLPDTLPLNVVTKRVCAGQRHQPNDR